MKISESPLFHGVPLEELPTLLEHVRAVEKTYRKGELLLHCGQRAERMGLVLEGSVHIVREDFWGNRSIVGIAAPGEVFAESYALAGAVLEVSVLAAEQCRVLFLDAGKIASACDCACEFHRTLSGNLLALLAEKNRMLTEKIRHMARRTTREKLLSYLSAQALRAGRGEFDIPLDRQQLADFLAVDRSAMSAELGKLRDAGMLEFHKNHFHLLRQERYQEEENHADTGAGLF